MVVQSIPLVTDLRTQNRNIGILYIASGSVTPGDSYGGMYLWDATSTAADDSFYVIQVTGVAVGRWIRIGAASNIYTSDGTLLNNRTVTLGGNTLSFAGSLFSTIFNADGTVAFGSLIGVGSRYVVAGPTGVLGTAGTIPGPGTPTRFIETFTASAGQTTFNTANTLYASFFDVFVNGVLLDLSSYTASANQVVLNDPCLLDDIIEVIGFINITYVGTLPPQAGQAGKFLSTDGTSLLWAANPLGTVTSVGLTAPTGFSVSNSPITTSGDIALAFAAGYSLPSDASQATWDTAYNRSLTSAAVTGTSSKTLTLNKQDGGTITATWSDYDTQGVTSVSVSTGTTGTDFNASVVNPTTTPTININLPDSSASSRGALTSTDWSTFNAKQAAITLTTVGSSGAATFISNTLNIPDYSLALSGYVPTTRTLTINGTSYDLSANRTWSVGTVTSVDMSVPTGLAIANNPITTSGTLALTFASGYSIPTNVKQGNWDDAYTWVSNFPTLTGNTGKFLSNNGTALIWETVDLSSRVPTSRTLTINGVTYDLSADRTWTIVAGVSSVAGTAPISAVNVSGAVTISISQSSASADGYLSSTDWSTFNAKQPAGNYITSLTGEATASGPGAASVTLTNSAVIGKVLTGLNVTGGSISATDSILEAFGKVQNQINGLVGGLQYQGTWDASTNTPTLTSSVGTSGYFYIVSVAGSTNLNGITDWKVGDWAVFYASTWQKVDNTESVVSVNGFTGAVSLTTSNIPEGTNLYYTDARARLSISLTTTGTSGAATYDNTTGVLNIPQYQGGVTSFNTRTGAITLLDTDVTGALGYTPVTNARTLTINGTTYDLSANRTWSVGTVTSVGLSMPAAFTVTNSPVTGSGTLTVTGAGTSTQYIDGTGALQTFPSLIDSDTLVTEVYNSTGATLTKGTIVYINGGQGNLPTVTKAQAINDAQSAQTFGFVQSDITNMNNGFVVVAGKIYDLDTFGLGTGTQLYLSPTTAGQWTTTKPLAPNHLVYVGIVVRDHPTQGVIEVAIQNGYELYELHDVAISTYGTKDVIYRDTATNLWKNIDIFTLMGAATTSTNGYLTSTDWNTFNNKVPATRTLTINGVGYDLSADRSWTIGPTIYSRGLQRFVATAGQTSFTITNGYTVGLVDVYRNGVKLDNSTEFTASNGTTVVLTDAAALNDVIEVYKYGSEYIPNNALRTVNTFTATAAQTTFSVTYSVGLLDVFYNGSKLAAAEYTATNGTTVVFANACTAGDIIEIIAYNYLVNAYAGISGSGNNNYIPKFTSASTIGNSSIQDNGTTITLGAALSGTSATFSGILQSDNIIRSNVGVISIWTTSTFRGGLYTYKEWLGTGTDYSASVISGGALYFVTNASETTKALTLSATGAATFSSSVRSNTYFQARLDGSATIESGAAFEWANTAGNRAWVQQLGASNELFYSYYNGTSWSSPLVTILNSGNVGIGTNSPDTTLTVKNTSWASGSPYGSIAHFVGGAVNDNNWGHVTISQNTTNNGDGGKIILGYGDALANSFTAIAGITGSKQGASYGDLLFWTRPSGGNNTERMRITSGGTINLGVAGTNAGNLVFAAGSNASARSWRLLTSDAVEGDFSIQQSTTQTGTTFSTKLNITSGGELLINTTTNSQTSGVGSKFVSNGRLYTVSSLSDNTQESFSMYSTGASAFRFYVNWAGTIYATNTTISAISDKRFKENIIDLDAGLAEILALKPRKFDWKDGKGKNIKNDRGFIAQEFEQIFPDLVDEWKDPAPDGEDAYKSIRQDLIPILVKAIQELNEKIKILENK